MKTKWRIFKSTTDFYYVEYRKWWWPFWIRDLCTISISLEDAKEKLKTLRKPIVYYFEDCDK
jgi:hypothetical protein